MSSARTLTWFAKSGAPFNPFSIWRLSKLVSISLLASLLVFVFPSPANAQTLQNVPSSKSVKSNVWATLDATSSISISGFTSAVVAVRVTNGVMRLSNTTGLTLREGYGWTNITSDSSAISEVAFSGTQADLISALRAMQVKMSSNGSVQVAVFENPDGSSPSSTVAFNFDTGNLYQLVTTTRAWRDAYCQAATNSNATAIVDRDTSGSSSNGFSITCASATANTKSGLTGYLVTFTSASEYLFVQSKLEGNTYLWTGATDRHRNGQWIWASGPESRQTLSGGARAGHFFTQGTSGTCPNGSAIASAYNAFSSGEPNGVAQDMALMNWSQTACTGNGVTRGWDDQAEETLYGYVVEYGEENQTLSAFASTNVTVDDSAPSAPTLSRLAADSDTGISNSDGITKNQTLIFTGTAEANSSVQLYRGGSTATGNACTVDANGSFSCTTDTLPAGNYSITAKATDSAGNTSLASSALSVTIDTTAPTMDISISYPNSNFRVLKIGEAATVSFALTEDSTNFDSSDVALYSAGTITSFAGSGRTYSATFNPPLNSDYNTTTVTIAVNSYTDTAGNFGSYTGGPNVAYDTKRPEIVGGSVTSNGLGIELTFSESISKVVTGATRVAGTSSTTINTANHGYQAGQSVVLSGIDSSLNGVRNVISASTDSFVVNGDVTTALSISGITAYVAASPNLSSFSVLANSNSISVSSVSFSDKKLTLNLASTIQQGDNVQFAYTDPTAGDDSNAIEDKYFNDLSSISATSVTNNSTADTISPSVTNVGITSAVTSGQSNFYKQSDVFSAKVGFSENVNVTGNPTISILVGSETRTATYVSGTGTTTLNFNYTVQASDLDLDGIEIAANSLAGTIKDAAGNNAVLTHSGVVGGATQKVDGVRPVISTVTLSQDRIYKLDETVTVTIVFSETVTVTGNPLIPITGLSGENFEYLASESTDTDKVFRYTVDVDDIDADGIEISANSINLNGGTIKDSAGNDATLSFSGRSPPGTPRIDGVAPTITNFRTSKSAGSYKAGEAIVITANLSETVTAGAKITVTLSTGATVELNYLTDSTLVGTYSVGASDTATALTVTSYVLTVAPIDGAGNPMLSTSVPGGSGNLDEGGTRVIVIDALKPVLSGDAAPSINENSTAVGTFTSDETVTWSLLPVADGGGADVGKFQISSNSGTSTSLSFLAAPNYEKPLDSDGNNSYLVTLKAVDLAGNVETVTVTVNVLNLTDSATVTSIRISSTPNIPGSTSGSTNSGGYVVGEIIKVLVTFTETVTVNAVNGYPRIELQGLASKFAVYSSGSGTDTLEFRYTVVPGDVDNDGIELLLNSIDIDEASIKNADLVDSGLNHNAIAASVVQRVDAFAPLLASSSPADNSTGVELTANIVLNFTKAVVKGTGNILIKNGATTFETIPVSGANVTISADGLAVTINPTGTFANATDYYVLVDGTAFKDASGNFFPGISSETTVNFKSKSALVVTTPSSGLTGYVGLAYTLTISTSGVSCQTSCAFVVASGSLPAGLALDVISGVITGTPTTAITAAITIKVTDASGTSATTNSFNITISNPSFRQFDNGKIRIGSATGENSVNNKGNFQQPWYKSGSTYFKLTYSSYSLNFAFGQGSTNTGYFNGNTLPLLQDPVLSNQVIDYSGFVGTSILGTGLRGYGTIISTGTFVMGGITYELKNTFVLGETSSSIRISTELKNLSSTTAASNVAFWVGTQDDWVGGTDGPTKTKGNLVNGTFTQIPNQSTLAKALRVSSGAEAVLFFTTFNGANTSFDSCCSFTNTTRKNPTTSAITGAGDGSYGMYIPMGNIAPLGTGSFTWYYAAGPTADLNAVINNLSNLASDVTAPTISSIAVTSSAGSDSTYKVGDAIDFTVTFSENVNVTGTPRIPIEGLTNAFATYASGAGTSQIRFRYVVQANDLDVDGVSLAANSLSLNSGSIGDASGNAAVITHSALTAQSAHKVDGVVPTLTGTTPADGATGVSVSANIELSFSEPVMAGAGSVYIRKLGATAQVIEQIPISGARVTFSGNSILINPDSTLESNTQYAVQIDNGAITDLAGNAFAGITNDTTLNFTSANASSPTISRVEAVTAAGIYRTLDASSQPVTISIKVVFSKNVTVTQGTGKPILWLETGATDRKATYVSGSGTPSLIFEYAVQAGDISSDLDFMAIDSLVLEGNSTITDAAGNNATLTLPNPGSANSLAGRSNIVIDAVAPTVSSSFPANGATNVLADANFTITLSENIAAGNAAVKLYKIINSSPVLVESATVTSSMISANVVTFNPTADLQSFSSYRLELEAGSVLDLAGNHLGSGYTVDFTSENFTATAPTITSQPTSLTSTLGRSVTLSSSATTTDLGTLSYQWYKNGVAINGATASNFTISSLTSADADSYYVVVTNTYRSSSTTTTSSAVTVTANPAISASFASTGGTLISAGYGTAGTATAPTVTGGTGAMSYSIVQSSNGQPVTGITINSSTGVITTSATLPAGTYNMSVTVTDSVGATFTTTINITIARKTLTVNGVTAANKAFDGSRSATLNFSSANLVGVESVDSGAVSIVSTSAAGLFDTADVGNAKPVTISGITLFGPSADNYQLTQPSSSANVTKGAQTISITSSAPTKPLPGRTYTPTAAATSALPVVITLDSSTVTSNVCALSAGMITFNVAGSCVIHFDQEGNSNWNAASRVTQTLTVGLLGQNITFAALSNKSYGDSAFQVAATTDSGLLPTYSTSSASNICTVTTLGVVKVIGVGTCEVTASQSGNASYQAAASVTRSFTINPVIPTAPRVSSVFAGNEQATISWTAPQDDGGSAITGYEVLSTPDDKICVTNGANALSCTVFALVNGRSYTFKVRAINAAGNGPWSVNSPAITPVTKADAVSNLVLIPGDGQLTVSWSPPENLGGGTFERYEIYIKRAIGGSYDSATVLSSQSSSTHIYTGLLNGVQYTVKVLTITSSVTSSTSNEISGNTAEVSQIPAQAPSAPRNLVAISPSGTSATVTWATPLSNGGAAITGYQVSATVGGVTLNCVTITTNSCFIETITVGSNINGGNALRARALGSYSTGGSLQVGVSAVNLIGAGETATVTVALPNPPGAPTITKVEKAAGEIQVTFTAPTETGGAPITGYTVVAYKRGSVQVFDTCLTAQLICGFVMVGEIYDYDYKVFASNLAGDGPLSAIFSPPTPSRGGIEVPNTPVLLPGSNGTLPTLSPGKSVVTDSGVLAPATVQIIDKTVLSIVNGDMNLQVSAINADKGKQEVKEGGILQFTQQEIGNISGAGFKAETKANIWLFSTPTKLGDFIVGKDGKLIGDFVIPPTVAPGLHTLQINGISANGSIVSYTIGVEVLENVYYKVQKADDLTWSFNSEIFKLEWKGLDLGAKIQIVGTDGSKREVVAKRGESFVEIKELEPGYLYTVTFTPEGVLDANSVKTLSIDLAPREPQQVKVYNLGKGQLRATWSRAKGDVEYGIYIYVNDPAVTKTSQPAIAQFTTKLNFVDFPAQPGLEYEFEIYSVSATKKTSTISRTTGIMVSNDADVAIEEPKKPTPEEPKTPTKPTEIRSSIYFGKQGAKLSKSDRAEIRKFAGQLKKGQKVQCVAFQYKEKTAKKSATKRAKAGCDYLKKVAKVKISTTVKVLAVKKAPKAKASLSRKDSRRIDLVRP